MPNPIVLINCYVCVSDHPWVSFQRRNMRPKHFVVDKRRWARLTRVIGYRGRLSGPVLTSITWRPDGASKEG